MEELFFFRIVVVVCTFLFQKWPKDGPSYDNAIKMFNINSLCYQSINCEIFSKLWPETPANVWKSDHLSIGAGGMATWSWQLEFLSFYLLNLVEAQIRVYTRSCHLSGQKSGWISGTFVGNRTEAPSHAFTVRGVLCLQGKICTRPDPNVTRTFVGNQLSTRGALLRTGIFYIK